MVVRSPSLPSAPMTKVSTFSPDLQKQLEAELSGLSPDESQALLSQLLRSIAKTNSVDGVLAYGEVVFGYQPAEHHREMMTVMLEALYTRTDTIILMPAGSAKTTWGNTIFGSWASSMFKDIRMGLFSQTDEFAKAFSAAIMTTLEENEVQHELFGDISHGTKWTQKEWTRKGSIWSASKDRTVFAGGTGGQVASKRFDLLLCDDILGEDNTRTADQREMAKLWWDKTLDPRVVADGVRIVFGTRWQEGDLYETLATPIEEGGYGFRTHIIKALIPDPNGVEYPDDGPEGTERPRFRSYWEAVWPVKKLIAMRQRNPATFDCTYQQDISGTLSGDTFQRAWFKHCLYSEMPPGSYTVRMGVDLASSERERADYTAITITAEHADTGDYYVLDAFREKMVAGHGAWLAGHYDEPPFHRNIGAVLIENTQFQSTLVAEMKRTYPKMPILGVRADADKRTRAALTADKYRQGKVFHVKHLKDSEFERELLGFPKGHDDWVDAAGYSMGLGGGSFFFGAMKRR